ncbi:MAG: hypothetical protein K2G63_03110 [Oscillospiraceae bacterium]|nr:hypothetical protein [Oscillospiraceae bacterium]
MKYLLILSAITIFLTFTGCNESAVTEADKNISAEKTSKSLSSQYLYTENNLPENILNITSASLNSDIAVCISNQKYDGFIYTENGGEHWESIKSLPDVMRDNNYNMVLSADGKSLIWKNKYITSDFGENWYYIEGLEENAEITADKVNPEKFYAVCNGTFYYSYDGGYNFISSERKVLNNNPAVPQNQEGHIWLIDENNNIIYSCDSGKSFSTLKNIKADFIYTGNIKDNDRYYLYAFRDDKVFFSSDTGKNWQELKNS